MSQELVLHASPAQWAEVLAEIQKLPPDLRPLYLQAARQHMEEQHGRAVPTVTIPLPAQPSRGLAFAYAILLGFVLLPLALAAAASGVSTLYGVLSQTGHGWGPALRSVGPFALEALSFHAMYVCALNETVRLQMGGARWIVVAVGACLIGLCVTTELVTSASAPEVAKRARVDAALTQAQANAAKVGDVKTTDAPQDEGWIGKARHEKTQGKLVDLAAGNLAYTQGLGQQQIENAKVVTTGESWGPTLTAIVGAIGGATVTVLLELFLRSLCGLGATRKCA